MNCPKCGRQLGESGECIACGVAKEKKFGLFESLVITVILIAVIGVVVIGFNKIVGNPLKLLSKLKLKGTSFYEVTKASKNLPVSREPQETITINQFAELRAYFENQQFDSLNSIFEEYQQAFETDTGNEYKLHDAYQVFGSALPLYEELFAAWLEHSPEHYVPYLARARYYYAKGWESRGSRWAKDTKEEQFSKMRLYFQKASEDIKIALNKNQNLLPAYMILIGIRNATADDQGEDDTIQNALELFPSSFLVRSQYMRAKKPRWGGSYWEMENFAKEAEKYADVNPHLPFLYGYIYCDQADILKREKKYKEAVELYTEAISYGDYWEFYKERAIVYYYYLKEPDKALEDVEWSIFLRPTVDKSYRLRSKIYYQKDDIENALADLHTAMLLNPGDTATQRWQDWAANNSLNKGHKLFKSDFTEAIEKYSISIHFNPEAIEAYYWRGVAYYRLNQFESALDDFKKAIDLDPHHFDSYLMLDYVLLETKEWDEIISYWNQFLGLEPDHDRAYLERSGTYYHKKEYAKSLKDLKASCDLGNEEACKRYKKYKNKWQ